MLTGKAAPKLWKFSEIKNILRHCAYNCFIKNSYVSSSHVSCKDFANKFDEMTFFATHSKFSTSWISEVYSCTILIFNAVCSSFGFLKYLSLFNNSYLQFKKADIEHFMHLAHVGINNSCQIAVLFRIPCAIFPALVSKMVH